MAKNKTNDQMFRALFKDLNPVEVALLRERVTMIMDMTMTSIQEEPEKWEKGFVSSRLYVALNEKVQKHIGFEEK